jgi:hypothetical protein
MSDPRCWPRPGSSLPLADPAIPVVSIIATANGDLACDDAAGRVVWRVGYVPEPWAWTPWQYATDGRFTGRWDDPDGVWRTLYVGDTRLACYLEVLAAFRADPELAHQLHDIDEDPADIDAFPTTATGALTTRWRDHRLIGSATLTGWYILPADKQSLPTLRTRFLSLAVHHRLPDLDAAAIRLAEPRALTQAIAGWAYHQTAPGGALIAGIHFDSRHGDRLDLRALFERPGDGSISGHLAGVTSDPIQVDDPDLNEALRIHRLHWIT